MLPNGVSLMEWTRSHLPPPLRTLARAARRFWRDARPPRRVFETIYTNNSWSGKESRSGRGSSLAATEVVRAALPEVARRYDIRSVLDIPCGDFAWMRTVDWDVDYTGGDIVRELVELNAKLHGGPKRRFARLDILEDPLPRTDLVLCRDCLVHFSYRNIARALRNLRASGSEYVLMTTFTRDRDNKDIATGEWRPLNLQRPPFNFPEPLLIVNERCPRRGYEDKSLALWRIAALPGG